jgi:hypothetical protein
MFELCDVAEDVCNLHAGCPEAVARFVVLVAKTAEPSILNSADDDKCQYFAR